MTRLDSTLYENDVMKQTLRKIFTRDFVLVFFAQFSFMIAYQILIPTLPVYLSRLGAKETEIGVLIGAFGVSSLISRPFVGRGLLKTAEKSFMIAGALLFAATCFAYLLAPPFIPFLIVRIFQGVGLAFFNTAAFTLVGNISPDTHRGQSLSYFFLSQNISLALAPALGMFIISHFSFLLLFSVCLGVSLTSIYITNKLERRPIAHVEGPPAGDRFLIDWKVLPPSFIGFLYYFTWGAVATFYPIHALNSGVTNPGYFYTTLAITLVLGRALGGRILDLYSRERVILYSLAMCIVSTVVLIFSKTLPMFILVGITQGIGVAFLTPSIMTYILDRSGSSRGPAMGTYTALSDLGLSLGPVVMGMVISLTSYSTMFRCIAFVSILNLGYFYVFVRKR
jgi:MFS family permease